MYPIVCSICIHNKNKSICIDCGGSQICIHNKRKTRCKLCDGKDLCKTEWCETYISTISKNKYEGYCLFCFIHLFPDVEITRNYKTKEKHIVDNIKNKFPDFTWISDKIIQDGCSKRRPDLVIDFGFNILVIEVDENQHRNYNCENKRTMQISQDFNHRPIVLIRFNPDSYTNNKNENILGCFKCDNKGILIVRNKKDFEKRLKVLYKQIEYWSNEKNINEKTLNIINLFYDNYD